ncbi:hypothetical protein HYQ22_gp109 [Acinetobacter phage vB_AbaM_Kimel]|uniref:Uncharacterized protein n=3 Tax=Lazarusvirus kimel TaxID=2843635 RepID=A0A6B9M1U3_9CAUD|nr:hypothetical protein HYQ22_gp109 [Acinetobacter phage vB_AbaM_Kimel]QHB48264.1 hypothetical protein Kimel_109 [Acinetobacter phage vB_AbaM_Kimel]QKE55807.1 hypothetical protein Octan_105 [Acinetobacter phage Octan]QNO11226.1 hypothetical protein Meroveus_105 [Acinetobacter phage Meroveus]
MEANIEQLFIESETVEHDDEFLGSVIDEYDAEKIQRRIEAQAQKRAQKSIKRNKKELERLKKHAGECLIRNNFTGYSYAIKKLREFYRQPYNDELIRAMWNSSREAMLDIAHKAAKLEQK